MGNQRGSKCAAHMADLLALELYLISLISQLLYMLVSMLPMHGEAHCSLLGFWLPSISRWKRLHGRSFCCLCDQDLDKGNFSNVGCSSMSCWTLFSNKQVFLLSHLWLTKETSQSYIRFLFACLSRDLLTGCQSLCPNVHLLNAVLLAGLDACPNCDCEFVVNLCYLQSILLVAKLFLTCQQWLWRIDHFTLVDSWGWVWG